MNRTDPLRGLTEAEARGRVLTKLVARKHVPDRATKPGPEQYAIRWRINGFTDSHHSRTDKTGSGNRFVILERLDDNTYSQPAGTICVKAKHALEWGDWTLEL